jgi:hypothetical protein
MANKTPHVTKILFDILATRAQRTCRGTVLWNGASVAPEIGVPLTGWLSVRGVSQRLEIKGLKFFRLSDHSLLP